MFAVEAGRLFSAARWIRSVGAWFFALVVAAFLSHESKAETVLPNEGPLLITYGQNAPTREGDPTHDQVIYIEVPEDLKERFYVRVFDPESSAEHDLIYGIPDGVTRYAIFGGAGAYAYPEGAGRSTSDAELSAGELIAERTFGQSEQFDSSWVPIALLRADQGEKRGDKRLFRLLVEGVDGNDGNLYDVAISLRERRQLNVPGARLFSYAPTIRVPRGNSLTELRFQIPENAQSVHISNFDAANGRIRLNTPFWSENIQPSGQDNWREEAVDIPSMDRGRSAAITLQGGRERPNDATFYVEDSTGNPLPLDIPPFNWMPNHRPKVVAQTTFLKGCRAVSFDATGSTDPDGHALNFLWRFSDGTTMDGSKVVKTYAERGRFTERLEVTDSSGQVANGSAEVIDVWVKAPPIPDIRSLGIAAAGESVTFDASASYSDGSAIDRYDWHFNDGFQAHGERIARIFEQPGDYQVTVFAKDNSGHTCDNASLTSSIRINAAPVAEAGPDRRIAAGRELQLNAAESYDVDGEITRYFWNFGDGNTGQGPAVLHTYAVPGDYEVTLTVSDDAGVKNSTDTDYATVRVNAPPVPELGEDRNVAVGEIIKLHGSESFDTDGKITAYLWEFGDGVLAFGPEAEYAYSQPGTYTIRLTVTDDSGTTTARVSKTISVRVNGAPVANAGPDQTVTASVVQFDGRQSTDPDDAIALYEWDFGDGQSGQGPTPSHVYQRPGVYTVKLTVTDASQTERNRDADTLIVRVNTPPIADAGPGIVGAPGEELVFQASRSIDPDGDIYEYLWDFKDGTTGKGETVSHAFKQPGRYFVALKVVDETGHAKAVDFDETEVIINAQPVANAGEDIRVAPGQEFTLDARLSFDPDGEVTDFRWDIEGIDEPIYAQDTSLSIAEPGKYTATLTIADDSGTENSLSEDQLTIHVNHQPKAIAGEDVFTGNSLVAFDAGASLDPDGDGLSYHWDFGDGNEATGPLVAHTYSKGGIYPVVLTVRDGTGLDNGEDRDSLTVTLNSAPISVAGEDQRICTGDILVLDGSQSYDPDGGVLKYNWDFGDGVTSTIVNPTKTYRKGGVYPVSLSVTDDSGMSNNLGSDQIAVTVDQAPVADAGADMKVCANTEISFDGSKSFDIDGVVNRFIWDFGDGGSSGGDMPKHIYRRAGQYTARLTIEGDTFGLCDFRSSDDVIVTVTAAPVPRIEAVSAIAVNETVTFDGSKSYLDNGEITGWSWDFGDGQTKEGAVQSHRFSEPGTYRVALTVDSTAETNDCREITGYHLITVNAAPIAEAGEDMIVGVNEEIYLDASRSSDPDGALETYAWNLGDGTSAEGVSVRHRYQQAGVYSVELKVADTADVTNSVSTDTIEITVVESESLVLNAPKAVCVGEDIALSANWGGRLDRENASIRWSFGDGTTAFEPNVSKTYQSPGSYNVSVQANDGTGRSSSLNEISRTILVNSSPFAAAGPDLAACPGDPVRFSAAASRDPERGRLTYTWDFGDGGTATGVDPEHVFQTPGIYEVMLTVSDDSGSSCAASTDTLMVAVNSPPTVDAGPDRRAFVGGANDAEIFSAWRTYDLDGTDLSHVWTFGEDAQRSGKQVTYAFPSEGNYEVKLTVDDGSGLACGTASDTLNVEVLTRDGVQG